MRLPFFIRATLEEIKHNTKDRYSLNRMKGLNIL